MQDEMNRWRAQRQKRQQILDEVHQRILDATLRGGIWVFLLELGCSRSREVHWFLEQGQRLLQLLVLWPVLHAPLPPSVLSLLFALLLFAAAQRILIPSLFSTMIVKTD